MSDTEGIRKLQVSDTDSISEFRHFSKSKFSEMRTTNEKIQQTFAFKEILDGGSVGAILSTIAAGE